MVSEGQVRRVLVVDDEKIVADTLVMILRGSGKEARAVYSGEDAAEVAISWKPDFVLTDVLMGQMDGISLAIYLGQALPSCKVLLMSGNNAAEELLSQSREQGHDFSILAKPFQPQSLLEILGQPGIAAGA